MCSDADHLSPQAGRGEGRGVRLACPEASHAATVASAELRISRYLTLAYPTADSGIKTCGVAGQALIARVKHAAGQVSRGTLAAPIRTSFAVAKIVGGQRAALGTASSRFRETGTNSGSGLVRCEQYEG